MIKRSICILFTVLFAFSAMSISAFAKSEYSQSTPRVMVYNGAEFLEMNRGEAYTLRYNNLPGKDNVTVPKGGCVRWYVMYLGGYVDGKASKDEKSCTITASNSGMCFVGAFVYDAKDNELSLDVMPVIVNYPGLRGAIDKSPDHDYARSVARFYSIFTGTLPSKRLY